MSVNWVSAYNRLFAVINREGDTYLSGPQFLKMVQQVELGIPTYTKFIEIRNKNRESTTRRDYYWDTIESLNEEQRYQLFRLFIERLEPHAKQEVDEVKSLIFDDGAPVPTTVVPVKSWNSEKLNKILKEIDNAIDVRQFNRAVTLTYTCLEGLYKSYVMQNIPSASISSELLPLAKVVKNHISEELKKQGSFPEQIVNSISTITNAVANSRNSFSDSHFDNDADRWLAVFARDLLNSVGRLLLHFM